MKLLKLLWNVVRRFMGLTDHISQVNFASQFTMDQIMATYSGSFVVPSLLTANTSFATNIPDSALFYGIWTMDGVTYVELGSSILIGGSQFLGVSASVQNGQVNLYANNNLSQSYTITYNIALVAKTNQAPFTLQSTASRFTGSQALFDSRTNYLKIVKTDIGSLSCPANTYAIFTVVHNLGYVPTFKIFMEYNSVIYPATSDLVAGPGLIPVSLVGYAAADTTSLYLYVSNGDAATYNINVHYRIYYDH